MHLNELSDIFMKYCNLMLGLLVMMGLLFSGCTHIPDKMIPPSPPSGITPLVNYALSLKGKPYRYGKESPQEGFDCSGFIQHVYERHGVLLPRTTREMAHSLPPVATSHLYPGDLVFFNTNGYRFSHVGLYVNNDTFIHAPSRRTGKVVVSSLNNRYWKSHFTGVRRPKMR